MGAAGKRSPDRVAIVTGAGRGIGAAVARRLAGDGHAVALLSPSGGARRLAAELGGIGLDGSVARAGDLDTLVARTLEAYGRIDALVVNPGHPPKGPLLELSDDQWLDGFAQVTLSVIRLCRLVVPVMRAQGGGAIVNLSSAAAVEPTARLPVSATMRAALAAFSKILADETAAENIRVNSVLLGAIDSIDHGPDRLARVPMARAGTVAEAAALVAYLVSDAAAFVTGQSIRIDGGETRSL